MTPLSINFATMVCMRDEEALPITNMFDADNEPTDCPQEAWMVVAGPMRDGRWFTVEVMPSERERAAIHN